MEDYKILFTMQINHDYFPHDKCPFFDLKITTHPVNLLRDRQLIFRKEQVNQWILYGNVNSGGIYSDSDQLWMEFISWDPLFLYYTKWENYKQNSYYSINLSEHTGTTDVVKKLEITPDKKSITGTLFTAHLQFPNDMYQKAIEGNPYQVDLNFTAKEKFWEFLFIPRKRDQGEKDLLLEESCGKLKFSKPEKTTVFFIDTPVWRSLSETPVKMKQYYDYQLDLLETGNKKSKKRRKIVKNIGYPEPGIFHDVASNLLRKIAYY